MTKGRVEAFSDGVIAIFITIMVLELKAPHSASVEALEPLFPELLTYVLSFIYIGIYWNNHHHMFHLVEKVTGGILWANLHLLFWLSLVTFATGWMGENHGATIPTAFYGGVLLASAIAYYILQSIIIRSQGEHSKLREAVKGDLKGKLSPILYALGIGGAFIRPVIAYAFYVAVALMWLIPDRRVERVQRHH